ncbi:multidrug efflux SMR transporter [Acidisoma sp. L85]|uniref:DMT family transporter n=1 Tax=Acidisoma sp. L85 TaxID=1641850 RepID=UPI00131CA7CC|nr:SMR family transporter [Acidisoma sp. L85]
MNRNLLIYGALSFAIIFEVLGTSFLRQTQQFTKLLPTFMTAISYFAACYFLTMPIGIAYAIWSGLGIVLISFVGFIFYKQSLDAAALIGLGRILAGVIVVNVFSKSIVH